MRLYISSPPPRRVPRGSYTLSMGGVLALSEEELERERLGVDVPVLPRHTLGTVDLARLDLEGNGLVRLGGDLRR